MKTQDCTARERDGHTYLEVCESRAVTSLRGHVITFDDDDFFEPVEVVIFRTKDRLYAASNICPHQHQPKLHEGVLVPPNAHNADGNYDCTITCPLHGWTYSLLTGRTTEGASTLKLYGVFEEDGMVFVQEPEPPVELWTW
jgi:nitrite reductase/ring-hydroxylating ferredoxin subunit